MRVRLCEGTYKRKSAVSAGTNLWLIDVDIDAWVAQWSTTAVAGDHAVVGPADGLLVDELDGCFWGWLLSLLAYCSSL